MENLELTEKFYTLLNSLVMAGMILLKNLIIAVIAYYLGKMIIKWLLGLTQKIMERKQADITLQRFTSNLLNIVLKVTLFIVVIGILGVKTASIVALVASAGFGIGLALNGTLQNFANGVLILVFRPFRVGDYINVSDKEGTVKDVGIFHTVLTTVDNKVLYIPNGAMGTATVVNYNHEDIRRMDFDIGIEYGEDFEKVKKVIAEIVSTEKSVLKTPEYNVFLKSLADSAVVVSFRCWTKTEDYWTVYFSLNEKIYSTFNQRNISFPFPQLTIHQA